MAWQCKIEHIHPINSSINKQRQHNDRKSFYENLFVVLFNDFERAVGGDSELLFL